MTNNRSDRFLFLLLLFCFCVSARADTVDSEPGPTVDQPLVKKISPHLFKIGLISFNKETREIHIPAQTNITKPEIVIEYLLVHFNGEKIHESLLTTEAKPTNINIALKLLNYKESQELFRIPNPNGTLSDKYPIVSEEVKKAARFKILITWKDNELTKTIPITDWIYNESTQKNMKHTPWIYNGSFIHEKSFNAKLTGSIVAIYNNIGAIANYSGDDRNDDSLWSPSKNTPDEGTPIKVTLQPWVNVP
ncbi:MAG: YdjY domain-containing protein [Akkermansiaceae bacterium]|nr:YdjY domain-containing protein [Akkermansiaceae bacterium]